MPRLPLLAGLGFFAIASVFVTSCKEEEEDPFGFTCIELVQADSQDTDPFHGTAKIKVTLHYEQCLIDYYTKKHSEDALDGTKGAETFAEWKDRLCSESVNDPLVACEVEEFNQTLLDNPPASVFQMTITYKVLDTTKINNRNLLWGPGPVEAFAECADNQRPYARLSLQSDVIGVDKTDRTIWSALTWKNASGIMQKSTAGCIQAEIARQAGT